MTPLVLGILSVQYIESVSAVGRESSVSNMKVKPVPWSQDSAARLDAPPCIYTRVSSDDACSRQLCSLLVQQFHDHHTGLASMKFSALHGDRRFSFHQCHLVAVVSSKLNTSSCTWCSDCNPRSNVINEHMSAMCWWAEGTRVCHRPVGWSVGRAIRQWFTTGLATCRLHRHVAMHGFPEDTITPCSTSDAVLHLSRVSTHISQPTTLRYYICAVQQNACILICTAVPGLLD